MYGRDTRRHQNQGNNYGYSNGRSGGAPRNHVIPDEPPFTAYIGNAPDTMVQGDFEKALFGHLKVKQVRLVRDRQTDRFRGFAYVDFEDADSLREAIGMDGTCVNDRPIRIDVAVRPLGASKNEGFRNKQGYQNQDDRRHPGSGSNRNYRSGGRNQGYNSSNQHVNYRSHNDRYGENQQNENSGHDRAGTQNQAAREHLSPVRKVSNDDVFLGADTPAASTDDGVENSSQDLNDSAVVRQHSRNWADCPIEESTVESSSPSASANNTNNNDDFQFVRNKNNRPRSGNTRLMGNNGGNRGRNSTNFHRGNGRNNYDPISPPYNNQSRQFYNNQDSSAGSFPNQRFSGSANPRQRQNSNRSNSGRTNRRNTDEERSNFDEIQTAPPENRPKLQLLPRSQTVPTPKDETKTIENSARNASIFGSGKPRDERDPKLVELNKHIEEVVEKEQTIPRTRSTASTGSADGTNKPVRILTHSKSSLPNH